MKGVANIQIHIQIAVFFYRYGDFMKPGDVFEGFVSPNTEVSESPFRGVFEKPLWRILTQTHAHKHIFDFFLQIWAIHDAPIEGPLQCTM